MNWGSFQQLVEDDVTEITVDLWLYGVLARYGGDADQGSYANLQLRLPEGSTLRDIATDNGFDRAFEIVEVIEGRGE